MNMSLKLPRRLRLGGIIEAGFQLVTSSGLKIICSLICCCFCLFGCVCVCVVAFVDLGLDYVFFFVAGLAISICP